MTPRQVLECARSAGLHLENIGDRLRITGGEALTQEAFDSITAQLRRHKAGVLQEMREEAYTLLVALMRKGKARLVFYENGSCWPDWTEPPGSRFLFRGEFLFLQDIFCFASPLPHHRLGELKRIQAEAGGASAPAAAKGDSRQPADDQTHKPPRQKQGTLS